MQPGLSVALFEHVPVHNKASALSLGHDVVRTSCPARGLHDTVTAQVNDAGTAAYCTPFIVPAAGAPEWLCCWWHQVPVGPEQCDLLVTVHQVSGLGDAFHVDKPAGNEEVQ
jgi:hypothetical protein